MAFTAEQRQIIEDFSEEYGQLRVVMPTLEIPLADFMDMAKPAQEEVVKIWANKQLAKTNKLLRSLVEQTMKAQQRKAVIEKAITDWG